jgi:16S rRNA (uracil1498-N3)-methyltransferase
MGLDHQGNQVSIRLKGSDPGRCVLEITRDTKPAGATASDESSVKIVLFQCMPKAAKMDLIIRQAVEAGVDTIVPVQSENSIPRLDGDNIEQKRQRWSRIARQAMQQCGRQSVPVITAPVPISDVPHTWSEVSGPGDVCLVFHEKAFSDADLHRLLSEGPRSVGICVGPEGGFSADEVAGLLNSGLQPVYINTNILRCETAALYAVAAVQTVILEKDSWNIS